MLNANESYGEDKAGVGMGTAGSVIFRRSKTMCDGGGGDKGRSPTSRRAEKILPPIPWRQTGGSIWRFGVVTLGLGCC